MLAPGRGDPEPPSVSPATASSTAPVRFSPFLYRQYPNVIIRPEFRAGPDVACFVARNVLLVISCKSSGTREGVSKEEALKGVKSTDVNNFYKACPGQRKYLSRDVCLSEFRVIRVHVCLPSAVNSYAFTRYVGSEKEVLIHVDKENAGLFFDESVTRAIDSLKAV